MTEENKHFEKLLDQKFENVRSDMKNKLENINLKLDHILVQTTKTNGKVTQNTADLIELMEWKAASDGHWRGVTKTVYIVGAVLSLLITGLFTFFWH